MRAFYLLQIRDNLDGARPVSDYPYSLILEIVTEKAVSFWV